MGDREEGEAISHELREAGGECRFSCTPEEERQEFVKGGKILRLASCEERMPREGVEGKLERGIKKSVGGKRSLRK